jgi:(4S)-4-hydroxy-5-phosphonooxypentane-2,3-dione isomerase
MSGFVVTVEFRLDPRERDGFLRLVTENARLSAETEPGCRQFDVVVPEGRDDRVYLYEIYDGEPDFELHRAQPHFIEFDRLTSEMVRAKKVTLGRLHFAGRRCRSRSGV